MNEISMRKIDGKEELADALAYWEKHAKDCGITSPASDDVPSAYDVLRKQFGPVISAGIIELLHQNGFGIHPIKEELTTLQQCQRFYGFPVTSGKLKN